MMILNDIYVIILEGLVKIREDFDARLSSKLHK